MLLKVLLCSSKFKLQPQFEVRRCHLNVTHHVFYDDYSARRISPADVISHGPLQLVMIEKSKTEQWTLSFCALW